MSARTRTTALTGALACMLLLAWGPPASAQYAPDELVAHRDRLVESMGEGVYFFIGAPAPPNDYTLFFQSPDFLYLTGLREPGAFLLMVRSGDATESALFYRPGDPTREVWEGPVPTAEEAEGFTGLAVRPIGSFHEVAADMLAGAPARLIVEAPVTAREVVDFVIETMGGDPTAERPRRSGADWDAGGVEVVSPARVLSEHRSIKSETEIELLRTASKITREAHLEAMRTIAPGINEFEIQALIEYTFRRNGAQRPGFATIVGSGPNSTVLHYNRNDRFMEAGDMVVMDIGASYGGYTTDITRTAPVSGTFSPEQRDIYEIVLEASLTAEKMAGEAGTRYGDLSPAVQRIFAEGLARLGLIQSPDARLPGSRRPQWSLWYMHGLGHGIGLVVHDSMPGTIQPGSCFTIEPGLYIRPDALDGLGDSEEAEALRRELAPAVERYAYIGVRIEDSYAFTGAGLERLSAGIPRTIEEVEAAMAGTSTVDATRMPTLIELYRRFRPPLD